MIHTHTTLDGRRIRYNDITKIPMAYILREGAWVRTSMNSITNQTLFMELLEKIANPSPKLEGVVRQISRGTET